MAARKKVIRALKICIIGLALLTVVLFALSLQTLFAGLLGAVSQGALTLEANSDEATGDFSLKLNANPQNNGILGERLFLSIGLLDAEGKYVAVNSTSVGIAPGELKPFSLILTVPHETAQKYNINTTKSQDTPIVFELLFGVSTLGDLVGLHQTMHIAGGNVTL